MNFEVRFLKKEKIAWNNAHDPLGLEKKTIATLEAAINFEKLTSESSKNSQRQNLFATRREAAFKGKEEELLSLDHL